MQSALVYKLALTPHVMSEVASSPGPRIPPLREATLMLVADYLELQHDRLLVAPALHYLRYRCISPARLLQKKRQSGTASRAPGPDTSRLDLFAFLASVGTINR